MYRSRAKELERVRASVRSGDRQAGVKAARHGTLRFGEDPEFLVELVRALARAKRDDEARELALSTSVLAADDDRLQIQLAMLLVEVGVYEDAITVLNVIGTLGHVMPLISTHAIHLRGTACAALGLDDQAEQCLREALERDRTNGGYIGVLAAFLATRGRRDEAFELVPLADGVEDPRSRLVLDRRLRRVGLI